MPPPPPAPRRPELLAQALCPAGSRKFPRAPLFAPQPQAGPRHVSLKYNGGTNGPRVFTDSVWRTGGGSNRQASAPPAPRWSLPPSGLLPATWAPREVTAPCAAPASTAPAQLSSSSGAFWNARSGSSPPAAGPAAFLALASVFCTPAPAPHGTSHSLSGSFAFSTRHNWHTRRTVPCVRLSPAYGDMWLPWPLPSKCQ